MHWFSLTRFHAEVVSNDTDVGSYTDSEHLCCPVILQGALDIIIFRSSSRLLALGSVLLASFS